VTDHEPQHFSLAAARAYLLELGPEGRKNLAVVLAWLCLMLASALVCGIVIGLLI
jgi:hypothetical protein